MSACRMGRQVYKLVWVTHWDPSSIILLDTMEPTTEKQTDMVTATHPAASVNPELLAQGLELIQAEKNMPLKECMRYHWRALLWGMVLSLALVMDGYDGAVTLSFFALPAFKEEFGTVVDGKLGIPGNWQAALPLVGIPGSFLGLFITGYCQDKYGSRRTYMGGMISVICVVFLFVFVQSLGMLLAAQALAAIGWAMFSESNPSKVFRATSDIRHSLRILCRRNLSHSTAWCRPLFHQHVLGYGKFHSFRW